MIDPKKHFLFSQNPSTGALELTISADLPYFDGHFPNNPILPGVAIIDASILAVELKTKKTEMVKQVKSAKFLGLVKPNDFVSITIVESQPKRWTLTWNRRVNDQFQKAAEIILEY